MIADGLRLSVWFGESITAGPRLSSDALMDCLAARGVRTAALLRGLEGFGLNRRIHAERFPDVSTDLPLVAVAVDEPDRIRSALADVDLLVPRGLVTLEHVRMATGPDIARLAAADGHGTAAVLTVHLPAGRRVDGGPAFRAVAGVLRRHGAAGAIVLPGVDGLLGGRRGRARLFSRNAAAPVLLSSLGRSDLRPVMADIAAGLPDALVTVERVAQLKHGGQALEPLPRVPGGGRGDVWQAIAVYARRSARVGGRALYSELTRRLREADAAGATTVLGDWGFSGDEPPHGDKLGRVASHRPTWTVYIDRPGRVAEVWPLIDDATARHGVVTSVVVPGYRELPPG